MGVWMSPAVWRHKRNSPQSWETWSLPQLPEDFLRVAVPAPLYVAIQRTWRGYFVLSRLLWTPKDPHAPFTLTFAPGSWTPIDPQPAPRRSNALRYTLQVPRHQSKRNRPLLLVLGGTKPKNELGS